MENLPLNKEILPLNTLIENYGDECPIIFYEPSIEAEEKKTWKNFIQKNSSVRLFSEFEKASKFICSLGISFILIFSHDSNEEMVLHDFRDLKYAYDRRMLDFEAEALLKDIFPDISDTIRKSLKAHVFVTLLDFKTEFSPKKDEEEVMVMCHMKEMTNHLRENFDVIWYDPHRTSEAKEILVQEVDLEEKNIYTSFEELQKRIENSNDLPYHLILTGKEEAKKIIKEITSFQKMISLYIYCDDPSEVRINNRKVIVEETLQDLTPRIIERIRTNSRLKHAFPAFATQFDAWEKSHIFYLHYYLKGLINFQNRRQAQEDFLRLAKRIYDPKMIFDFEKEYYDYNKEQILAWYIKESPVYKLVNNCLRIATSDSILYCRYILRDLERAIKDQYQQKSHKFNGVVYRGAYTSKDEWEKLQKNVGKEIEMYGFISTSRSIEIAKDFVGNKTENKIFITIIIPPLSAIISDEQGFAEISEHNIFDEAEILFNVRSKFKIVNTGMIKIDRLGKIDCRHLVLLYGPHLLRKDMTEGNQPRQIELKLSPEVECTKCSSKDRLFVFNQEKTEIYCIKCLLKTSIPKSTPLFALDLKKDVGVNEKIMKDFKGKFLSFNKTISFSNCGYKCHNCERTNLERYFRWIALNGKETIEQCFECFEKKEQIESDIFFLEETPHEFWLEYQAEWEKIDSNYQKELSERIKDESQAEVFMEVQRFDLCIEYEKRTLSKLVTKRWSEMQKLDIFDMLGRAYQESGEHKKALEYFQMVLGIRKAIHGKEHPDIGLSYSRLASVHDSLGDHNKAIDYFKEAGTIAEKAYGKIHQEVAKAYNNIASAYRGIGKYKEAFGFFVKAELIMKIIFGEQHPATAILYNNLGSVYWSLGKPEQAFKYHEKAFNITKAIYGEKHPQTASLENNLGSVYESLANYEKAEDCHQRALRIRRLIYGENHSKVAESYNNLASVFNKLGKFSDAIFHYKKVEDINQLKHSDLAISYNGLASVYWNQGKSAEAQESQTKALDIIKTISEEKDPKFVKLYNNFASMSLSLGKDKEAQDYLKKALQITKNLGAEEHPDAVALYRGFGSACKNLGKYKEAEDYYNLAWNIVKRTYPENHPETADSYASLASLDETLGEDKRAFDYYQKAFDIKKNIYGENHPDLASLYRGLGCVCYNLKNYQKALESYTMALHLRIQFQGEEHPNTATMYNGLGYVCDSLKRYKEAQDYFIQALRIREEKLGVNHQQTVTSYNGLASVYCHQTKYKKALELSKKSLEITKAIFETEEHQNMIPLYNTLGSIYQNLKKYQEAFDHFQKSLDLTIKFFGGKHPNVGTYYTNIAFLYSQWGKKKEAEKYERKALAFRNSV